MIVDDSDDKQITIKVSSSVNRFGFQRLLNYMRYLEATSESKAKQTDIDKLADEVNSAWWEANKSRFVK